MIEDPHRDGMIVFGPVELGPVEFERLKNTSIGAVAQRFIDKGTSESRLRWFNYVEGCEMIYASNGGAPVGSILYDINFDQKVIYVHYGKDLSKAVLVTEDGTSYTVDARSEYTLKNMIMLGWRGKL